MLCIRRAARRTFSSNPTVNNTPAYLMGALGLGGLAYVSYMGSELGGGRSGTLERGEVLMSDFVQ